MSRITYVETSDWEIRIMRKRPFARWSYRITYQDGTIINGLAWTRKQARKHAVLVADHWL